MPYKDKAVQSTYQNEKNKSKRRRWLADNGPCRHCGSWENLEVDHVDPSQKIDHRIWSLSRIKREAELAKCQVLCHDCHVKKTCKDNDKGYTIHGNVNRGYGRGCRCIECRAANASRMAKQRQQYGRWEDRQKFARIV